MITKEKINIYKRYNGDGDAFIRGAKKKEKMMMGYDDWRMIDDFVQDIILIKGKLTSDSYKADVINRMNEFCENEATIKELWEMESVH